MDLQEAHERATDVFDRTTTTIGDNWDAPTPCSQWTVRDVVNHVTAEQLWAPHLLRGETIEEVGDRYDGDVLGRDPEASWRAASAAAREAWQHTPERVILSYGKAPTTEYRWQMTLDLAVHAWDVAKGTGSEIDMGDELAEALYAEFRDKRLGETPLFDDPRPTAPDADPITRLVALLGREPSWSVR